MGAGTTGRDQSDFHPLGVWASLVPPSCLSQGESLASIAAGAIGDGAPNRLQALKI